MQLFAWSVTLNHFGPFGFKEQHGLSRPLVDLLDSVLFKFSLLPVFSQRDLLFLQTSCFSSYEMLLDFNYIIVH